MFVVLIGSVVTLAEAIAHPSIFTWSVTIWLVLTVGFANFAEAVAEGRGKAQANALRRMRTEANGRRLRPDGAEERVAAAELVRGDLVITEAGDVIPSDGEIIEGMASVDESARFAQMRAIGIRTVMVTGDNPLTAAAIAQEAGVDDYLAEATPEAKMSLIKEAQRDGKLVAMTGDGTNDAPALAQADVGVAMNTGTTAAKEAGNMVDLDSNPTKLMDVVEIGTPSWA